MDWSLRTNCFCWLNNKTNGYCHLRAQPPSLYIPLSRHCRSSVNWASSVSNSNELGCRIAASVGAIEALKDQGFWRWNHGIRALNQSAKNNVRSYSQANKLSSSSIVQSKTRDEKVKAGWGIFEKVTYLGCLGPYWHWWSFYFGHICTYRESCSTLLGSSPSKWRGNVYI